jgi:hypothetical protein
MKTFLLSTGVAMLLNIVAGAQIINVPSEYFSIQTAISAASDGDTVVVAEGTYYENINLMGKAITLSSQFILDGDTSHITNTIIDGSQPLDQDSASVIMFTHGESSSTVLQGFTITGGTGVASKWYIFGSSRIGGGILCINSFPKILDNKIVDIHTSDTISAFGGGLAVMADSGDFWIDVKGNTFSNNSCTVTDSLNGFAAYGGGMYISANANVQENVIHNNSCSSTLISGGGGAGFESLKQSNLWTVQFNNNDVQFNSLAGVNNIFGAGLHVFEGHAFVDGNTISNNTAISEYAVVAPGANFFQFKFNGVTYFTNNTVEGNYGEGIQDGWGTGFNISHPEGPVVISGNHFYNNETTVEGIAYGTISIWVYFEDHPRNATSIKIDGNVFESNDAETGSAIVAFNQFNTQITNNLFYDNNATEFDGGAIFMRQMPPGKSNIGEGSALQYLPAEYHSLFYHMPDDQDRKSKDEYTASVIANNTFLSNTSQKRGGAIYSDFLGGNLVTFNNIFWGNEAMELANDIFVEESRSLVISFSDIDEDNISGSWTGTDNFYGDPMLDEEHIHLTSSSLCIDAGTDSLAHDSLIVHSPSVDIDGEGRPLGGGVDVGADEYLAVGINPIEHKQDVSVLKTYPNPFSSYTYIGFSMEQAAHVTIRIFSLSGQEVFKLTDKNYPAGDHRVRWSGTDDSGALVQKGLYFVRMQTGNTVVTKKITRLN